MSDETHNDAPVEAESQDPKQLDQKVHATQASALGLQEQLDVLNAKKEAAFTRKQEIGNKIAEKIHLINDQKAARNDLTRQVREMKVDRDKLNAEISAKIAELKALQPAKPDVPTTPAPSMPTGPHGERLHPREIERKMKLLEEKIETVPMSFEAEQKTMKEIKALKKQLGTFETAQGQSKELHAKSKEIDALKKQANTLHAKVTQLAKESQSYHEKLLNLSKEIEDLKAQEDAAQEEFFNAKKEFVSLAGDAKEVRSELQQARNVLREHKQKERKQKDAEDQKTLQQRADEARKKMMSGEKLTTEDLLAMQSVKD